MPTSQSIAKVEKVQSLVASGLSVGKAMEQAGVSPGTYYNVRAEMKKKPKARKSSGILVRVKNTETGTVRAVVLSGSREEVAELLRNFV